MQAANFPMCCGIKIINDMDTGRTVRRLQELMTNYPTNVLQLIAINGEQKEEMHDFLIENQWQLLTQHTNGGHESQNFLYGYHPLQDNGHFRIFGGEDRQEPRVIDIEIYANLRDIGRRGPFSSIDEACSAYPLCRQIDRREIMSNGNSNWTENV